ncbi:MAG: hypothetical protein AB7Q17_08105 [Phycisphaerae bacterium]
MPARIILASLFAAALVPAARADDGNPADLRIQRVALFSSGVGYFERHATVSDDATAELRFRTDQINDILKSLVVQDLDGGSIGVVGYASRDPVEKALRSFGVDIAGKPTLAQLLDQLRGEPVQISGARNVSGVILGVEKQKFTTTDNNAVVEFDVLNLVSEAGLQQLRLNDVQGVKLTNEKVDAELRKALATLAASHDADKKSVYIDFTGKGSRRVQAAYLLETPIWKTSYRLVLAKDKKPFLQGWATVENATEEDWKDVRLSLVSGRPISFRMDLYTPLYVPRPMEQLELYASLRPPEYAAGYEADNKAKAALRELDAGEDRAAGRRGIAMKAPAAPPPPPMAAAERLQTLGDEVTRRTTLGLDAGVASVAEARAAGELFEYAIDTPVTIARQHSAMLPIVNQEVEAEKVSIYNPATHAKHPLNGLLLTNSSKLNLMQGPVTVFDADTYAGDAKLPDLRPDEKRLVAYALDLGMEVNLEGKSAPEELVSLKIVKGTLWHKRRLHSETIYQVKNKQAEAREIILEQPVGDGWQLVEPKEPFEKATNLLRFKLRADAQKTTTFSVKLELLQDQAVAITNLDHDTIQYYLRARVISPPVKQALERVVALRVELDQAAQRRADAERGLKEAVDDQARIRENLKSLDRNTDTYQGQLKLFDEREKQIETRRQQVAAARAEEEQKRAALDAYLLALDVE